MATETTEPRNWPYLTVKSIAYAMFTGGLIYSVSHIFGLFHDTLHASVFGAILVSAGIDGSQLIGRVIRGESFSKSTRRTGWWLQGFGAVASVIANILAGQSLGDQIAGPMIVVFYVGFEMLAESIRPTADDGKAAAEQAAQALAAKRSAAAAKGVATKATNKAKATSKARTNATKARQTRALAKQVDEAFTPDTRAYL